MITVKKKSPPVGEPHPALDAPSRNPNPPPPPAPKAGKSKPKKPPGSPRRRDASWLINRAHVRKYALGVAAERAHKFTRVSGVWLQNLDTSVRVMIRNHVLQLPSKGATIK